MASATYVRFTCLVAGRAGHRQPPARVFPHLLELSPAFFEQTRTGEVTSRLTSDTVLLEQVVGTSVSMAVRNALLGIGSLIMLALTSWKLTLLVLLMVPVVVAPIVLFGRRVRRLSRASQDRVADLGAQLDETLHEIRTVQAYGHEAEDRRLFGERLEAAFQAALRRAPAASLTAAVIPLVFGGVGVILWIGGHDVLAGRLTAGELSAFVFYALRWSRARSAPSARSSETFSGAGAAERLIELMSTQPQVTAPTVAEPLPEPPRGTAQFVDVSFFYPAGRTSLPRAFLAERRAGREAGTGRSLRCRQDHDFPR
jgi:ATP-binding cassette subfamily B protein